ncbi:MAG: hypothetical protein JXR46_02430 [Calditrichaceae bacterium]|nr:hypothetical protein [Calditrichaceae bacterium]MBN2707879.1 hypothetical protein [Calditrichaceae bacterium]RQV97827.1 MAG: hypothetical protein EH224_00020 [Calditrichota bacterium]
MKKAYVRWILAIIITVSAAIYQRLTGPTYPLTGRILTDNGEINYTLKRSHGGEGDHFVEIMIPDTACNAQLIYKRYKTDDEWTKKQMWRDGNFLRGQLPHQPPAGKLEYYIKIEKKEQQWLAPADKTVITRFKGAVPVSVLLPHALLMFIAMFLSNLTALEALAKTKAVFIFSLLTTFFLLIGGMILGPIVQNYAFGEYWTGIPHGWDLTDNKTLFGFIAWLIALFVVWKYEAKAFSRWMAVIAAIILLAVFSIPHSTMGSEFDYTKMEVVTGD